MLIKEMLEKEYAPREFPSPIGSVCVTKERNIYNAVRTKYQKLAEEAYITFSEIYSGFQSCNDIVYKGQTAFQKSIAHSIDEIKKDLISIERYDLDYDTIYEFANKQGVLDVFYEVLDEISNKIKGIYGDLEERKAERELQKENRGRWEGGTLGGNWAEAISHQMTVGVMNLAEGGIYSAANMIGNASDTKKANNQLDKILRDPNTKGTLSNGVYSAAFQLHYALIALLQDSGLSIVWDSPKSEAIDAGNRLLNNLKSGAVPAEKVNELYLNIIDLNPYNIDLFGNLLDVYRDKEGQLGVLADYYGVDLNSYKDEAALKYVKDNQGTTEEDSVKAKEMLLKYCEDISLNPTDDLECMQYITERLFDFDLQYRTVDGVVCETRDGADFAREELDRITEFMRQISAPTSESLLDYEEDLLAKRKAFEETFSSELKEKYLDKINDYLKEFDTEFCSIGLFKTVTRKEAGQERLFKLVKKHDVSSPEQIDKAYNYMQSLLPKVGLEEKEAVKTLQYLEQSKDDVALQSVKNTTYTTEEQAVEAKQKLLALCEKMGLVVNDDRKCMKYINKILADFDLKYRTIEGIVCTTREEAGLAYEELDRIHSFMNQISAPTAESLLDYEEDLLAKRKQFEETFVSKLKEKYLSQIDAYLADFDKKFCSTGFMKKVDRKQAGRDRALKFAKKLTCATLEEANQQLDEFLPKVGLSREEAQEAVQYLDNKYQDKGSVLGRFFKK